MKIDDYQVRVKELKDILDENTLKVKKLLEGEKSETNIRFYNTNRTTVSIYRK